nr:hypothetical protein [Tanacetum cinerariifolium]
MATKIDQQTALDESLVPSTQRAFQVTTDVPEIYMQEFWAMAKLHHNSIRFRIDTRKSVLDLEAFREMLHISPRIPNQSFADLPTKEEILDFLRINWHYVRDDALFSTIKVVSRHQTTQQYGAVLPIELTTDEIRNKSTEAEQLKIVLKKSRQETHISQHSGSGTDEGTGSKPWVLDVPSDDSEEELSWKSSDDEDVGGHEEGNKSDESDDDHDEG